MNVHLFAPSSRPALSSSFERQPSGETTQVSSVRTSPPNVEIASAQDQDRVSLSSAAINQSKNGALSDGKIKDTYQDPRIDAKEKMTAAAEAEREQVVMQEVKRLASRDREVRAHEQAHMAAGGQFAGSARYEFQRGPNGVNYAVGGEVPISTSPAATPEETIRKAQVIRAAALAPAEPSSQDRKVAAMAGQMEVKARSDLAHSAKEEASSEAEDKVEDTKVSHGSGVEGGDAQEEEGHVAIDRPYQNVHLLFSGGSKEQGLLLSDHA